MNDYNPFASFDAVQPSRDLRAARRQIASPAIAVAFIFAATFIIQVLAVSLISLFAPELAKEDWYVVVLSSAPMYAVAMPLSLAFFRFAEADPPTEKKKLGILAFLGLVALCFAMTIIGNIIGTVVNAIISVFTGEPPVNELQEMTTATPLWANLLFVGILAPIMEEIFFRKLVIDRLRGFGDLPAILISGLMFGLLHGNFNQVFYATVMGFVFGYIYLYTGRLRYTVALHMTVNLIGGVFASEMIKLFDFEAFAENAMEFIMQNPIPVLMLLGYYLFIGICFIAAPIALVFFWKHIHFRKSPSPLNAKEWGSVIFKNPAIWLFAAMVVLLFAL